MTSKKRWVILLTIVSAVIFLVVGITIQSFKKKYEDWGVPIIDIHLNGVTLSEIDNGNKSNVYEGNELTIYEKDISDTYREVEMKGRGNGTWVREKKPYQIKFKQKVNLFDLGKAKRWVLLADYIDSSHLRNELAFKISEMLGMKYGMKGRFVELYVDEDYRGLYYLTHAVEINKDVVDLKNPMGLLMELDNIYGRAEDNRIADNGDILVLKDIVSKDLKEPAMDGFIADYNELIIAIEAKDYDSIAELIDVESFAQYYLLSEISVNPDAYWTSVFFYKDGLEDKIHAGPAWDFDLAFANRTWGNWLGERFYSPRETMIRKEELQPKEFFEEKGIKDGYETSLLISDLFFNLMDIEGFREEVKRVFQERLSGREVELMSFLSKWENDLRPLAKKDGERWGRDDYDAEIQAIINWLRERMNYIEEQYGDGTIRNNVL